MGANKDVQTDRKGALAGASAGIYVEFFAKNSGGCAAKNQFSSIFSSAES